jgi:hypothetical protein
VRRLSGNDGLTYLSFQPYTVPTRADGHGMALEVFKRNPLPWRELIQFEGYQWPVPERLPATTVMHHQLTSEELEIVLAMALQCLAVKDDASHVVPSWTRRIRPRSTAGSINVVVVAVHVVPPA